MENSVHESCFLFQDHMEGISSQTFIKALKQRYTCTAVNTCATGVGEE